MTPAEILFSSQRPALTALWRPAGVLWKLNRRMEAIAQLNETTQRSRRNAGISIPTMFLVAQLQMEVGDTVGAEQRLQTALKKLTLQPETKIRSSGWTHRRFAGIEASHAYALRDRDWLILAIHALLKNDLDSCLLWIHQADRQVFDLVATSKSRRHLRLIGDLHAVLACLAVQSNEVNTAEKFLATAYRSHSQAEAFRSICRDLILTSRLAMMQGQTQRAGSLLKAAECQLILSLSRSEADRSPLMRIIHTH